MNFSDLHIHILSGVDDGPKTEVDMYAMADAAYAGETTSSGMFTTSTTGTR